MYLCDKTDSNSIVERINFEKLYFHTTLVFAFILPLSRAGISILTALLILLWFIESDFKRKYREIISSRLLTLILIFLAYNISSFLWSSNLDIAINIVEKIPYWVVIFVLATSIKKESIQSIITAFLLGMFISEIIAYGVFFELWTFKNATPANPTPFMMHIDYSVYMAFSSILLLHRVFSKEYTLKEKIVLFLFFLTVTGNLFLSIGRTGQVALVAGIIVMSIIHFRLSLKSFFISFFLIFTIFTSAYNISDSFEKRVSLAYSDIEKISNMNFNSSWGIRVAYWITSYNIFKQNPIIGVGIGDYMDKTKEELEREKYSHLHQNVKTFMPKYHPHNQYLLILLQLGIIGILLFLYIIYKIFTLSIEDKEIKELSILFGTIFFVSCIPESLLLKQFTIALFVLFIGLFSIFSISKIEQNS